MGVAVIRVEQLGPEQGAIVEGEDGDQAFAQHGSALLKKVFEKRQAVQLTFFRVELGRVDVACLDHADKPCAIITFADDQVTVCGLHTVGMNIIKQPIIWHIIKQYAGPYLMDFVPADVGNTKGVVLGIEACHGCINPA